MKVFFEGCKGTTFVIECTPEMYMQSRGFLKRTIRNDEFNFSQVF